MLLPSPRLTRFSWLAPRGGFRDQALDQLLLMVRKVVREPTMFSKPSVGPSLKR